MKISKRKYVYGLFCAIWVAVILGLIAACIFDFSFPKPVRGLVQVLLVLQFLYSIFDLVTFIIKKAK